jgi:hypothetical protein
MLDPRHCWIHSTVNLRFTKKFQKFLILIFSLDGKKTFRSRAKLMEFLQGFPIESAETYQNGVEEKAEEVDEGEEEEEEEEQQAGASLSAVQQYVADSWQRAEDSTLLAQPDILRANLQAALAGTSTLM